MKVILSRKGFDSSAGGCASPIVDGRLVSLPIPDSDSQIRYQDLQHEAVGNLGQVVADLTRGRIAADHGAHLDPDLDPLAISRGSEWCPIFGQVDAAQSHLEAQGVGPGDIFLMFGWFRDVEKVRGVYRFVNAAPDIHAIYGWFQIGSILTLGASPDKSRFPSWAIYHPHFYGSRGPNNSLYVAADELVIDGVTTGLPGAGRSAEFQPPLQLTAADSTLRSVWQLPAWFDPKRSSTPLSYHGNPTRWEKGDDGVRLRAAGRGQEFVFDTEVYPEAHDWLRELIRVPA